MNVSQKEDRWTVDNGILTFTASPSYFPGFYSLSHQGHEFLHHQYPEAGPRSWWNPWGGGLRYVLDGVSPFFDDERRNKSGIHHEGRSGWQSLDGNLSFYNLP
ncbi:hypothetical protein LC065_01455 [Halobacillus litoralis]|uniref:hypothetical protein n=1 Tax=Halobacillus litoralis TaxID=45668 RepID=UPI00273FFFD1|nr:hypothetical protein [Halobacillus litoralis]WLR47989.1 hypothetical protein LC065_01455 [Halobacillus litoralis]